MKLAACAVLCLSTIALAACDDDEEPAPLIAGHVTSYEVGSVHTFWVQNGHVVGAEIDREQVQPLAASEDGNKPIPVHVVRIDDDTFHAFYANDPTYGCFVLWRPTLSRLGVEGTYTTLCGPGDWYDAAGRHIEGPSPRDLDRFPACIARGNLLVTLALDALILGAPTGTPPSTPILTPNCAG
jgi:hypothetical protein